MVGFARSVLHGSSNTYIILIAVEVCDIDCSVPVGHIMVLYFEYDRTNALAWLRLCPWGMILCFYST